MKSTTVFLWCGLLGFGVWAALQPNLTFELPSIFFMIPGYLGVAWFFVAMYQEQSQGKYRVERGNLWQLLNIVAGIGIGVAIACVAEPQIPPLITAFEDGKFFCVNRKGTCMESALYWPYSIMLILTIAASLAIWISRKTGTLKAHVIWPGFLIFFLVISFNVFFLFDYLVTFGRMR